MKRRRSPVVVAIGGFDPSCGAGVVADARSIDAMGAVPVAVVTAITVQSGTGLKSFSALPVSRVLAQLDELLASLPVAAFKIGQVPTAAIARALGRRLSEAALPVVLDPVLRASGGGDLVSPGTVAAILRSLVPHASLLTVNLAEASILGRTGPVTSLTAMRRAAAALGERGAAAVLVKGGHRRGDPADLLVANGRETLLRSTRIAATMHGTGCALASATAARLACGDDLEAAVRRGREHVRILLRGALHVGRSRLRAPASY